MMDDHRPRQDLRREPTVVAEEAAVAPSDEESESDGEFEFPFVSRDAGAGAPADELFAGGRIRAFYPVFGRVLDADDVAREPKPAEPPSRAPLGRLFQLEQARTSSVASTSSSYSSSSSRSTDAAASDDLDGAPPDSYCLWAPGLSSSAASSPSRPPRKSGSTGSMARWRRIGELVVGRSHSDGREKFLFLSAPSSPARDHHAKKQQQAKRGSNNKQAEVSSTRMSSSAYGTGGGGSKGGAASPRRTFLPYRQDLVGLFANVHGLRRNHHHPF